jgi:plasmid stabilization system protein ParE
VRSVAFHPEADAEFTAAARYYERQAENLGFDFIAAVEATYQRLVIFPESGRPFGSRLRRILVPGFPYGLVYRPEPDHVLILAVAHVRRRPG